MCRKRPCFKKDLKSSGRRSILELILPSVIFLSILVNLPLSIAETQLSTEYGEVIYQCNEKSPNQLSVIGMSHRDALTRLNGNKTSRVQAEVYKIGEWLIHQGGSELLLPEGFFLRKPSGIEKVKPEAEKKGSCPELDMKALERILSDNHTFINAEMLMKKYHSLILQQVEEEKFYNEVSLAIQKLINSRSSTCDYLTSKSELDYLQERRVAVMLQKIPKIVEDEFQQGNIRSKKAIFTIGMFHLHKIIQYLSENRIRIPFPLLALNKGEDYIAELNLQKENFGVSIILPRTLLDDPKVLEMNRLDKIVSPIRK